jgi:hypothetical protein
LNGIIASKALYRLGDRAKLGNLDGHLLDKKILCYRRIVLIELNFLFNFSPDRGS